MYALFLPVAFAVYLPAFQVADPSRGWQFWLPLLLMGGANIALLWKAIMLPLHSLPEVRMWLITSPVITAKILLGFFGADAIGPGGKLMHRPWSFAWATQLLVGAGWTSIWLPRDYADHLPENIDRAIYLKTAHDEYQSLVWPSVALAMTVFLASIFQIAQSAAPQTNGNRESAFGVLQGVVVVFAGLTWCVPVLRILGHVSRTRWMLAGGDLTYPENRVDSERVNQVSARSEPAVGVNVVDKAAAESALDNGSVKPPRHGLWVRLTDILATYLPWFGR